MKSENSKHYIDGPLTMIVFGIFAACIVLTLLAGAGAYKRLSARDMDVYNERTCLQYIATKLRSAESPDAVDVVDFGDGSALQIREIVDGKEYVTKIYSLDGKLMELYCLNGIKAGPSSGEALIDTEGVDFSIANGIVKVKFCSSGSENKELMVYIRGAE